MKHLLTLEAFGYDRVQAVKTLRRTHSVDLARRVTRQKPLPGGDKNPWAARIVRIGPLGPVREFLKPFKDFSEANRCGSRGVRFMFALEEGEVYEVFERHSWKSADRYFCRFVGGKLERLKAEEVLTCLP